MNRTDYDIKSEHDSLITLINDENFTKSLHDLLISAYEEGYEKGYEDCEEDEKANEPFCFGWREACNRINEIFMFQEIATDKTVRIINDIKSECRGNT